MTGGLVEESVAAGVPSGCGFPWMGGILVLPQWGITSAIPRVNWRVEVVRADVEGACTYREAQRHRAELAATLGPTRTRSRFACRTPS